LGLTFEQVRQRFSSSGRDLTFGNPNSGDFSNIACGNATCLLTISLTLGMTITAVAGQSSVNVDNLLAT
jgi:hypothetical protein